MIKEKRVPNSFAWVGCWLSLVFGTSVLAAEPTSPNLGASAVRVETGDLAVLFRSNHQSPQRLSGIDELINRHAPGLDAFDPDAPGASAGLNFEHIISGHRSPHHKFTPRLGIYRLYPAKGADIVRLVRDPADSPWNVGSTFTYEVRAPHYIDFDFRCTPQDATLFGTRGWAIFFFACYMNDVEDSALHFRGLEAPAASEKWIAADAPPGHPDWNQGGNYRSVPAADLAYDDDVEFRLNT